MSTNNDKSVSHTSSSIAKSSLKTFFRIMDAWGLSNDQSMTILGLDSKSTFFKWKSDYGSARLNPDKLERLSYIFGIYKALQILLPKPESADAWIKRPNKAEPFNGQSALDRMLSGYVADLFVVRQYLDSQRGWS